MMPHMLNDKKLEEFLSSSERNICDFKEYIYTLSTDNDKGKFIKDILCMANTPRSESAYIIIGIKQATGKNYFRDVDLSVDENQFLTIIKSVIGPEPPNVSYYQYHYHPKKVTLGIFEIGISNHGPYYSKKDYTTKVIANKIYYRFSSSNTDASDKMILDIKGWMKSYSDDRWETIMTYMQFHSKDKYNYILVYEDNLSFTRQQLEVFPNINWSAIIDLSKSSEQKGFYFQNKSAFEQKAHVHLITKELQMLPAFYEGKSLFWIMAGGENDVLDQTFSPREWYSSYARFLMGALDYLQAHMKKTYIILTLSGNKKIGNYIDSIVSTYSANTLFNKHIIADLSDTQPIETTEKNKDYINLEEETDDNIVKLSVSCNDIYRFLCKSLDYGSLERPEEYLMPSHDGAFQPLKNIRWLLEEITPLYKYIEMDIIRDENYNALQFYKGCQIRWDEMNPPKSISRTKQEELKAKIEKLYGDGIVKCLVIPLYYLAGAGATTLVRNIAWQLHSIYPVVFIEKYSLATAERLKSIYLEVQKRSLIVFIDSNDINLRQVSDLKNSLDIEAIHVIIITTIRCLQNIPQTAAEHLNDKLDRSENNAFRNKYMEALELSTLNISVKEKRETVINSLYAGNPLNRTPFLYGLSAFEEDFVTLESYVKSKMGTYTKEQEEILLSVAMAYCYGAIGLPRFILQNRLYPNNKKWHENTTLSISQQSLIFSDSTELRTVHQCIAKEIIIQICLKNNNNRVSWSNMLKTNLLLFLDILSQVPEHDNDFINGILRAVYLDRNTDREESRKFAMAIEELPTIDAKKGVLEKVVEMFPKNPHAHSHLARFYHYIYKDDNLAQKEINIALGLAEDYTFYHIKGTIQTSILLHKIKNNAEEIRKESNIWIPMLLVEVDNNAESFKNSRDLKPENMYAYGSHINIYISVIKEYKSAIYPDKDIAFLLKNPHTSWCVDLLDKAKEVLEEAKDVAKNYSVQFEEEYYTTSFKQMVGNLSDAIQGWDNLLCKQNVYYPPVRRQIVIAYQESCEGKWSTLPFKKRDRALSLLEENILQESSNEKNILMWLDLARNINDGQNRLDSAIEKLQFFTNKLYGSLKDFYCYVLCAVRGMQYTSFSDIKESDTYLKKSSEYARNNPKRGWVREFYEPTKNGLDSLINYTELKHQYSGLSFNDLIHKINRVCGRIKRIDKAEIGWIELSKCKLQIKFNPNWEQGETFIKDKDEGAWVNFVIGFTFDGIYAYDVKRTDSTLNML